MAAETVDDFSNVLHDRGWSCGDMSFNDGRLIVWQVFAHRGDQRIVARAPTQSGGWVAAVEQLRRLELAE